VAWSGRQGHLAHGSHRRTVLSSPDGGLSRSATQTQHSRQLGDSGSVRAALQTGRASACVSDRSCDRPGRLGRSAR
jgi:hypothetical protein